MIESYKKDTKSSGSEILTVQLTNKKDWLCELNVWGDDIKRLETFFKTNFVSITFSVISVLNFVSSLYHYCNENCICLLLE